MNNGAIVQQGTMTLTEYMGTPQGQALKASRRVFCWEGRFWGRCRGELALCHSSQLLPHELDDIIDMDGTKAHAMQLIKASAETLEHDERLEHSRKQATASKELTELQETAQKQIDEFCEADPDLLLTIENVEQRLRFKTKTDRAVVAKEIVRNSPEYFDQFRLQPGLHHKTVNVPVGHDEETPPEKTDEPSEPPGVETFETRMARMEGMVSKLFDLVTEQTATPEPVTHAETIVTGAPLAPEELAERAILPTTTCTTEALAKIKGATIDACGKSSPSGHLNPPKWLMGHIMAKHIPRKKRGS